MSDEMKDRIPPAAAEAPGEETQESSSAWHEVIEEFDALGEAIARWAKSAVNDPENRRRLDELGDRLENLIDDVGASIKGAVESDVGHSFREAADKTGEAFKLAGTRFSEEVGPRLASTFRTVGDKLRGAADRMDERTDVEASAEEPVVIPAVDQVPPEAAPGAPAEPAVRPADPTA